MQDGTNMLITGIHNSRNRPMPIEGSRRRFLSNLALAGAAGFAGLGGVGLGGSGTSIAAEPPPETTTMRMAKSTALCIAPFLVAEELLRAEGFTNIEYIPTTGGFSAAEVVARGDADLTSSFAGSVVYHMDRGLPLTALAGVHSGCYELFAYEPIRSISDLKGQRVGIQTFSSSAHLYLSIMARQIGLDPRSDIQWVTTPDGNALELFARRRTDAFLAFPPEPQELRERKIGRVILSTASDKPWSEYFCCVLYANRTWFKEHPIAAKRAIRAILKATDFCGAQPEQAARRLVDRGFTARYDYALRVVSDIPYTAWRDLDAEDSMRFYALGLYEAGMISSSPNKILSEGADWRVLNELRRELKA
jgi:NitT/TauT family transport system substrate-binding protein